LSRVQIQRFGMKLHKLRLQRGITLKELAQSLGHVSHGYISELESGKKIPTVEFVLGVSLLFNVSADILLRDDMDIEINTEIMEG